jgi:hypothetical protein
MTIPSAPKENAGTGDKILALYGDTGGGASDAYLLTGAHLQTSSGGDNIADLRVYPASGTLLHFGYTLVGGGPEAPLGSFPCQKLMIRASSGNGADVVYVGTSFVTADEGLNTSGWPLAAGEQVEVPCRDAAEVYVNGTAGDKIALLVSLD